MNQGWNLDWRSSDYHETAHHREKSERGFMTNFSRNRRDYMILACLAGLLSWNRAWFEDATCRKGTPLPDSLALYTSKRNSQLFWKVLDFLKRLFCFSW
jgi:hypothetical protein